MFVQKQDLNIEIAGHLPRPKPPVYSLEVLAGGLFFGPKPCVFV